MEFSVTTCLRVRNRIGRFGLRIMTFPFDGVEILVIIRSSGFLDATSLFSIIGALMWRGVENRQLCRLIRFARSCHLQHALSSSWCRLSLSCIHVKKKWHTIKITGFVTTPPTWTKVSGPPSEKNSANFDTSACHQYNQLGVSLPIL